MQIRTNRGLLATIAVTILLAFLGANTEYAAKASGLDTLGVNSAIWLARKVSDLVSPFALLMAAMIFLGAAISSWGTYIGRSWLVWWSSIEKLTIRHIERRLLAMTLMWIFGTGFALSALWYGGEKFISRKAGTVDKIVDYGSYPPLKDSAAAKSASPTPVSNDAASEKPPRKSHYEPDEISAVLKLLDQLDGLLNRDAENIYNEIYAIVNGGWARLWNQDQTLVGAKSLEAHQKLLDLNNRISLLENSNQKYRDELRFITKDDLGGFDTLAPVTCPPEVPSL